MTFKVVGWYAKFNNTVPNCLLKNQHCQFTVCNVEDMITIIFRIVVILPKSLQQLLERNEKLRHAKRKLFNNLPESLMNHFVSPSLLI